MMEKGIRSEELEKKKRPQFLRNRTKGKLRTLEVTRRQEWDSRQRP